MADFWMRFGQNFNGGSRTDVLRALVWPNAGLLAALVYASTNGASGAVVALIAILLVSFLLLYAVAYAYFGKLDPNLLRSEKYNIQKMAIEHGIYGDNISGIENGTVIEAKAITSDTAEGAQS
jgi:hypothetical protein